MASDIPAVGTVSYNGYTFSNMMRCQVSETPVYDDAGRTVKYVKFTVNVDDIIQDDDGVDDTVETVRARLTKAGQKLVVEGIGFGDLFANAPNAQQTSYPGVDLVWGPQPRVLSWAPLGPNRACRISWTVECHLSECSSVYGDYPLAYGYSVSFGIDDSGMTVRTIDGYIEIPITRDIDGTRNVSDGPDLYLGRIQVVMPPGYRRTWSRHIEQTMNRLRFTVTDTQISTYNAYPENAVKISMTQSIRTTTMAAAHWQCSIRGTVEAPAHVSPSATWKAWLQAVTHRWGQRKKGTFTEASGAKGPSAGFFDELSITEDIYGRPSSFSFSYRLLSDVETIFKASGLWQPVPGADWSKWKTSLGSTFGNKGHSGLYLSPSSDVVFDLCGGTIKEITMSSDDAAVAFVEPDVSIWPMNEKPPPESSWYDYQPTITVTKKTRTVRQRPLPLAPPSSTTATQTADDTFGGTQASGTKSSNTGGLQFPSAQQAQAAIIQTFGQDDYVVKLSGYAVRYAYGIPIPRLIKVGDQKAHLLSEEASQTIIGNFGYPLYALAFALEYALESAPTGMIPFMPSPAMGSKMHTE